MFPRVREAGWASELEAFLVMDPFAADAIDAARQDDPTAMLRILARLGIGLDALHAAGGAHLNVSPDNVLIGKDGDLRVTGLGTGWLRSRESTGEFAAPEMTARTEGGQAWRADVYSFARTTCGLLGAAVVPEGSDRANVELPPLFHEVLADAPALRLALERCLDRRPDERPGSLAEVVAEMERAAGHSLLLPSSHEEPQPPMERTVKVDPEAVAQLRAEFAASHRKPRHVPGTVSEASAEEPSAPVEVTSATSIIATAGAPATGVDKTPAASSGAGTTPPSTNAAGTPPDPSEHRAAMPSSEAAGLPLDEPAATSPPIPGAAPSPATPGSAPPATHEATMPPPTTASPRSSRPRPLKSAARPPAPERGHAAGGLGRTAVWAAIVVVPILVLLVAWQVLAPRRPSRRVAAPTLPSPVAPVPTAGLDAASLTALERAEALLASGDIAAAEAHLAGLPEEQLLAISRFAGDRLVAAQSVIAERHVWEIVRDLDAALAAGDLRRTEEVLERIGADGPATARPVELERKLSAARRLVESHRRLTQAEGRRRWGAVLEYANEILTALPQCGAAVAARERAAVAIESSAEALAQRGSFDAALNELATLRRWVPDRPGLAARARQLETARDTDRTAREAMRAADEAGQVGEPDRGLEILTAVPESGRHGGELRALRARLQSQLAMLDARSPRITLAGDGGLEYERNQTATVRLGVEDDYAVRAVAFFARRRGGSSYAQFSAEQTGTSAWTVAIPAAFHQNETVEFYATAIDASGHRGELGTAEMPLELKRRRRGLFGR